MTGVKDRMQAFHFIGMIQFGVCHKHLKENCQNPWENKSPTILSIPGAQSTQDVLSFQMTKVFSPREVAGNLLIAMRGNKNVMES